MSVTSVICKRGLEYRPQSPANAPECSPAYHRGSLLPFWRESPASQRRHSLRATLSCAQRLTGQPHYVQLHLRICASWRWRSGRHLRVRVRHMMQRPACKRRSQLGWRFLQNAISLLGFRIFGAGCGSQSVAHRYACRMHESNREIARTLPSVLFRPAALPPGKTAA